MADYFKASDPQQPEIRVDNVNGWLYVGELSGQRIRLVIQLLLICSEALSFTQPAVNFF